MAYSASDSRTGTGHRGLEITLTETDASLTDEATLSNLPVRGRILVVRSARTAGGATLIDPIIGLVAAATDSTDIAYEASITGLNINEIPAGSGRYYAPGGQLFHRSRPDVGNNNAITTKYLILAGW